TIIKRYEGTRLGRQELNAEILDDVEGALWTMAGIDATRVQQEPDDLLRVVVGVDPAVTSGEASNETGIVVCAMQGRGKDAEFFVLEDYSLKASPDGWARRAVQAFEAWDADIVVGEVNNGGDLVEHVIRTVAPRIPFKAVRASRGKQKRAEPVAALWEQGRAHVVGNLPELETQMTTWVPGLDEDESPDRMDAMVWALTELMGGSSTPTTMRLPKGASRIAPWRGL